MDEHISFLRTVIQLYDKTVKTVWQKHTQKWANGSVHNIIDQDQDSEEIHPK